MDYIEKLTKQASELTMYDVKSYYNQAKNMVLNVPEMEAKVREATNDDPWGASTTLMQQIADGTHNFTQFNEIMPTIYARFMEKEAREWRQIYKALTLLEYLVKNGSERVVDDARAHVSTIKMLRSFHYIDEKGKDQGINVRNRASEIALLLGDVEKIRQERRKAKSNKSKFAGQGNDGGMSFVTASGGRYGGFGSDSVGGGGGGGGGGYDEYSGGGSRDNGYDNGEDEYRGSQSRGSSSRRQEYDEYEGADDFADNRAPRRSGSAVSRSNTSSSKPAPPPKAKKEEPKKPEVNLFDFGDDDEPSVPAPSGGSTASAGGDDDFDDFVTGPSGATPSAPAPSATSSAATTRPSGAGANAGLFDLLDSSSPSATSTQQAQRLPSFGQAPLPTSTTSPSRGPISSSTTFAGAGSGAGMTSPPLMASRPSYTSYTSASGPNSGLAQPAQPTTQPAQGAKPKGAFDDLFTASLSSMGGSATQKPGQGGKSMGEMGKEKAMSSIWTRGQSSASTGQQAQPGQQQQQQQSGSSGIDDLLF